MKLCFRRSTARLNSKYILKLLNSFFSSLCFPSVVVRMETHFSQTLVGHWKSLNTEIWKKNFKNFKNFKN